MTAQMRTDARLPSRRWFLLTLSVFLPLALVSLILFSAGTAEAEPLAPTAIVSGMVVKPDGFAITDTAPVCLNHFSPNPDEGVDWWDCKDTDVGGYFVFTGAIPSGDLFVVAEPPWNSDLFPSLDKPLNLAGPADVRALGNLTLTFASFAGTVHNPDGSLASGGKVTVDKFDGEEWHHVAGSEYSGTFAIGAVPSGPDFQLVAQPPMDSILVPSPPVPVGVAPGSQYNLLATQNHNLVLHEPNLVGRVVYPENGADVTWIMSDTEVIGHATGQFGFGAPPGEYWVTARPEGELWMTYTRAIPMHTHVPTIPVFTDVGPLTLTFPSFAGMILDPAGGVITECMSVWLENLTGDWMADFWYCGEEGPYVIGGIPDGDYRLMADGLPERGFFPPHPVAVAVGPGSQYDPFATQPISLTLVPPQLEVFIEDPSGDLITGSVQLLDQWGGEIWRADATPDRPALFGGFNPGDHFWLMAWPGWEDVPYLANSPRVPVTITAGVDTRYLPLQYPNFFGAVETPNGNSLPPAYNEEGELVPHPAEVSVHTMDWTFEVRMLTAPGGQFSFALPPGDYVLDANPMHSLAPPRPC